MSDPDEDKMERPDKEERWATRQREVDDDELQQLHEEAETDEK